MHFFEEDVPHIETWTSHFRNRYKRIYSAMRSVIDIAVDNILVNVEDGTISHVIFKFLYEGKDGKYHL